MEKYNKETEEKTLPSGLLKITVIQSDIIWENIVSNLHHYQNIINNIQDTDLIIFPEMFATGFTMNTELFTEENNRLVYDWLKCTARDYSSAIIAGTGFVKKGKFYNKSVFIDNKGNVSEYDKRHLFSPGNENVYYEKGNHRITIEYKGWKIFPQVCYDLRFPVWSRNIDGYDLLIYVANWPAVRNDHWLSLLKARAIENQAYVIGVNRVGKDGNGIYYIGNSVCFRYDGKEIYNLAGKTNVSHTCILDHPSLNKYRKGFSVLNDRDDFQIL